MKFIHLFWLVFSVFLWGFIHSLTASHPFKAYIRRVYGTKADRYYRVAYNAVAVVSFIVVLLIAAFTPGPDSLCDAFPMGDALDHCRVFGRGCIGDRFHANGSSRFPGDEADHCREKETFFNIG